MEAYRLQQRNTGFAAFFFSGICAISSGVIVSMLQERIGFDYSTTGTLLSFMNIGNLAAGFIVGLLSARLGMKRTVGMLSLGYLLGYLAMAVTGHVSVLAVAFFALGMAKGSVINACTLLVGNNCENRTKGMNMMHSCYAFGALLCPFVIGMAASVQEMLPMLFLAFLGMVLWLLFVRVPMQDGGQQAEKGKTDWSFLKNKKFWLLTGLLFCQNSAEMTVTGWLVTYFKGSGLLSAALSPYTVTIMWGATLIARLLIAFVFPLKKPERAMIQMGIGCTLFYVLMMRADSQWAVLLLLFAFSSSMAGMNPTAVAAAGRMTSAASMGIMLPAASAGAILMPWITGLVASRRGIHVGMACNMIPCAGMLLFSILVKQMTDKEQGQGR